ncbi:MAG TPA: hypothetical protein DGG94_05370 [Micromonosporaceae bacterium]|nr:hypothetical protein [Micromonosporaceae bacterium]HCU49229.1 hypothetical protein [Micromonosporaceae bacterium]
MYWLGAQWSTFDGVPGQWRAAATGVVVRAAERDGLRYGSKLVDGELEIEVIEGSSAERGHFGDGVQIEMIQRGRSFAIRVRDPHAPALAQFRGIPVYENNDDWVVEGRFEPFDAPRALTVGSVIEGLTHDEWTSGVVHFEVAGNEFALTAFGPSDEMSVLFRDATSGVTTAANSRELEIVVLDDGRVRLDFNRAYNMPCAFTDYSTCPLPPPENMLKLAVEAGEKDPSKGH